MKTPQNDSPFAVLAGLKAKLQGKTEVSEPENRQGRKPVKPKAKEKVFELVKRKISAPAKVSRHEPAAEPSGQHSRSEEGAKAKSKSDQSRPTVRKSPRIKAKGKRAAALPPRPKERTGNLQYVEEIERWLKQKLDAGQLPTMEAPRSVARIDQEELKKRTTLGTGVASLPPDGEIEVVLGFDFGTTSSKLVAAFPYEAGRPMYAIPAPPSLRAEGHAHLFHSKLWISRNGEFHLAPGRGRTLLPDLKRDVIAGRPTSSGALAGAPVTPVETLAAFIALHVRQARGWLLAKSGAIPSGKPCNWSTHIGLPAETLNGEVALGAVKAAAAGLSASESALSVSVKMIRSSLASVGDDARGALEALGGEIVPEISAAVAGFAQSRRLEPGLYSIVDIGGLTIDCCTFDLRPYESEIANPIFEASVSRLGVETLRGWIADERSVSDFQRALHVPIRTVIRDTKVDRAPLSDRWSETLPLFITGGGKYSRPHKDAIYETDLWLKRYIPRSQGVKFLELPPPENLIDPLCEESDVHRLTVAIGLSRPFDEIPRSTLPKDVEDFVLPRRKMGNYVGSEQV